MRIKSSIKVPREQESEIIEIIRDASSRELGIVIEVDNHPIYDRFPKGKTYRSGFKHLPVIDGEYYYRNFVKYDGMWVLTVFDSHDKRFTVYTLEQETIDLCEEYLSRRTELLALEKTEEQSREKSMRMLVLKYSPEKIVKQLNEITTN